MGCVSELVKKLTEVLERLNETPFDAATPEPAPEVGYDLTIGIATYDDFDGAWFTVNSLRVHHPEVMARAEILVLDNHPEGKESTSLKALESHIPGYRYIPVTSVKSTAIRDLVFQHARGSVVMVLDSHVLLPSGAVAAVLDYFDARPGSLDLVQGPMLANDGVGVAATHWNESWTNGMFGSWATDQRGLDINGPEFDIPLQGLAAFACRTEAWPGLNPRFVGFGGEEGYLHTKFRQRGGRTVCLPAFRWLHRFDRPRGVPYPIRWMDRIRNYAYGWTEVGLDVESMFTHFREYLGESIEPQLDRVREEIVHPLSRFDGIIVINDDLQPGAWRKTAALIADNGRVARRVPTVQLASREATTTASLQSALAHAVGHGWKSTLVIGDRFIDYPVELQAVLTGHAWPTSGVRVVSPSDLGAGADESGAADAATDWLRSMAIAVQQPELDRLHTGLPSTGEAAESWALTHSLHAFLTAESETE